MECLIVPDKCKKSIHGLCNYAVIFVVTEGAKFLKTEREQILSAAIEDIRVSGYQEMKLTRIANSLKITHATIYRYYPDKDGLRKAVIYYEMESQLGSLKKNVYNKEMSLNDTLYKFLWVLSRIQKEYCISNHELFLLSKHQYISDVEFREKQNNAYFQLLRAILKEKNVEGDCTQFAESILKIFSIFFVPYFSYEWYSDYYQAKFDTLFDFAILNNYQLHNSGECDETGQVRVV